MRSLSILLALALVAFSGCTEPVDDTDGTDGEHDHDGHHHGGNGTHNNTAPEATLEASAVNGTAPLNVTFSIGGSDADGDNLTWTLEVDGEVVANGTELPAQANHTFAVGNHTAVLVVSDGMANASATLDISAVSVEAAAPLAPIVFTGSVAAPASPSAVGGPCFSTDAAGVMGNTHAIGQDVAGWSYSISSDSLFWAFFSNGQEGDVGTLSSHADSVEVCIDAFIGSFDYTLTLTPPS